MAHINLAPSLNSRWAVARLIVLTLAPFEMVLLDCAGLAAVGAFISLQVPHMRSTVFLLSTHFKDDEETMLTDG